MSIAIEEIVSMPVSELAAKSGVELIKLMDEADKQLEKARTLKEWIQSAIAYKYVYRASQVRAHLQQNFGEVEFDGDDVRMVADLPREVIWDQKKLSAIAECIKNQGEDPAEFLDIQYHVPEERFDYWPETIQRAFEAAFTIKAGRLTYRLVALNREAAA